MAAFGLTFGAGVEKEVAVVASIPVARATPSSAKTPTKCRVKLLSRGIIYAFSSATSRPQDGEVRLAFRFAPVINCIVVLVQSPVVSAVQRAAMG